MSNSNDWWAMLRRDLKAGPGNDFDRWLRVGLTLLWFLLLRQLAAELKFDHGKQLFQGLSFVLYITIWMFGPLLVSDCLSKERREGTLELLLLTPMGAEGIVIGKTIGCLLRCSTVIFVGLPFLAIPICLGGVTSNQIWQNGLHFASALLLAVSASIVASARCREQSVSLLFGWFLSAVLLAMIWGLWRFGAAALFGVASATLLYSIGSCARCLDHFIVLERSDDQDHATLQQRK